MRLLLILLLAAGSSVKAQVSIIPEVDSALFSGVDNKITIRSGKLPLSQLRLQATKGAVSGSNGNYVVRFYGRETQTELKVFYKGSVVAGRVFTISQINDPVAFVAGDSIFGNGDIPANRAKRLQSLLIKSNYTAIQWRVSSFNIQLVRNGKITRFAGNLTNNFTPATLSVLKQIMPGDEIIIDDIKVQGTDAYKRAMPPVRLKVI